MHKGEVVIRRTETGILTVVTLGESIGLLYFSFILDLFGEDWQDMYYAAAATSE